MEEKKKLCCTCKEELPIEKFGKNKAKKDGLMVYCRSCSSKQMKKTWKKSSSTKFERQSLF